jgi:lipopolysaccharide transport system ATP-binding protein
LEVGTGFHPELTGRENIYLNGAILGMRRGEMNRNFEQIVEFSEIGQFLDTPVKRYSSGMYMRLAFSVAAHLDPEILLVDEVLAVGDAGFQKKCLGKMGEVASQGRTVIFVSHQMDMIRALCGWAILLGNGHILSIGTPENVVAEYLRSSDLDGQAGVFEVEEDQAISVQIIKCAMTNTAGEFCNHFDVFEQIRLDFDYVIHKPVEGSIVNFEIKRNGTTLFFSFDTDQDSKKLGVRETGRYHSRVVIPAPLLKPGQYTITPGTGIANSHKIQHLEDALSFRVDLTSRPSTFLSYAEKRSGSIAVPLDWHTQKMD